MVLSYTPASSTISDSITTLILSDCYYDKYYCRIVHKELQPQDTSNYYPSSFTKWLSETTDTDYTTRSTSSPLLPLQLACQLSDKLTNSHTYCLLATMQWLGEKAFTLVTSASFRQIYVRINKVLLITNSKGSHPPR